MLTRDGKKPLKNARFCDSNCKDSYKEDRMHGLIYPAINLELDDGWHVVSHITACRFTRECPYCGAITKNR